MIYRVAHYLLRSHETPGTGLPEQFNLFSTTEHIQFTFCIFIDRYIIYKTRGRPARLPRVFRNRNLKIADDSFLAPAHWGSEPILALPAVSPILWQSSPLALDRNHFKISIERVTTLIWLKTYIHFYSDLQGDNLDFKGRFYHYPLGEWRPQDESGALHEFYYLQRIGSTAGFPTCFQASSASTISGFPCLWPTTYVSKLLPNHSQS